MRPRFVLAGALGGGALLALYSIVTAEVLLACIGAALLLGLLGRSGIACAAALGACGLWWVLASRPPDWPAAERRERVLVSVEFDTPPEIGASDWRALAPVRPLDDRAALVDADAARTRRVQVAGAHTTLLAPKPGERWQLVLSLRPTRATLNPGAVDMERIYFRDRVEALASVRASPLNRRLRAADDAGLQAARQRLADAVDRQGSDRDADALFLALAAGLTDRIDDADWRLFNTTGISHLIAISGSHVTGLAALLWWLAQHLWRAAASCGWHRVSREHFATAVALSGALGYALFAGFSVPTQRTLLMLAVWRLARSSARQVSAAQTLSLALLVVLLVDPLAPLSAGFWLSFVAMAVLLWIFPGTLAAQLSLRQQCRLAIRSQWCMTLALAPLTAAMFGAVPLAGMLVNLAAIPLFSLLLVPLALLGALLLLAGAAAGVWVLEAFSAVQGALAASLAGIASIPLASWNLPQGPWAPLALVVLAFCALPSWPWRVRALLLCALAGGSAVAQIRTAQQVPRMELLAIDAGQALAVLVRVPGADILIDTGDGWRSAGAVTRTRILPALRALGVGSLDAVVLGRPSADRGAGLAQLTSALPVRAILAPAAWQHSSLPLQPCATLPQPRGPASWRAQAAGDACVVVVAAGSQEWWIAHTLNANDERELARALAKRAAGERRSVALLTMRRGAVRQGRRNPLRAALGPERVLAAGHPPGSGAAARSESSGRVAGEVLRTGDLGAIRVILDADGRTRWASARLESPRWPWRAPGGKLMD